MYRCKIKIRIKYDLRVKKCQAEKVPTVQKKEDQNQLEQKVEFKEEHNNKLLLQKVR